MANPARSPLPGVRAGSRATRGTWSLADLRRLSAGGIAGLVLALFILGPSCLADTIRVTTWNLESAAAPATNQSRVQQAAAELKKLNPDVILLQEVSDWQMCDRLAQALKPAAYKVLICSSFRAPGTGTLRKQQVAILAKRRAYFCWSEAWRAEGNLALPGGLAFAAVQVGQQRVGLFSVQADVLSAAETEPSQGAARLRAEAESVGQLLEQVASVTNWVANRVQVLVVGGTFDPGVQDALAGQNTPLQLLEEAGFGDACLGVPAAERETRPGRAGQPGTTDDYIFTQPMGCAGYPRIPSAPAFVHRPVTCDVELDPAKAAEALASRLAALPARESPPASQASEVKTEPRLTQAAAAAPALIPTPTVPQPGLNLPLLVIVVLAGIIALAAVVWAFARRVKALSPATSGPITDQGAGGRDFPSSYTVVIGTRSATQPAPGDPRAAPPRPLVRIETPGVTQTQAEVLRQRALAAEQRAERADAVIRNGLIPHLRLWLKQKLVRKLIVDREQLLQAQQAATLKTVEVEERLTRIEQQIQQQISNYQERIETLTRELIVAKEENRELIRAQILQVKAEMAAARARLMAQSESDDKGGS